MKKLSYLLLLSLLLTGCKSDDSSVSDENSAETTEHIYDSSIVFSADETAEDDVINEISDILSQRLINAYPELNYTTSVDYELNTIQFNFDMIEVWHTDTAEFLTMPNSLEMRKGDSQDSELILTNEDISSATLVFYSTYNEYSVTLTMNETGSQAFSDATAELAGTDTPISIWLDDELISSPTVTEYVYNNEVVISGGFTKESAQELAIRIGSAHLPYELNVKEEKLAEIT